MWKFYNRATADVDQGTMRVLVSVLGAAADTSTDTYLSSGLSTNEIVVRSVILAVSSGVLVGVRTANGLIVSLSTAEDGSAVVCMGTSVNANEIEERGARKAIRVSVGTGISTGMSVCSDRVADLGTSLAAADHCHYM